MTATADRVTFALRATAEDIAAARRAAMRARQVLPGALGELTARELDVWAEFGFRYTASSLIARLIRQINAIPLPERE